MPCSRVSVAVLSLLDLKWRRLSQPIQKRLRSLGFLLGKDFGVVSQFKRSSAGLCRRNNKGSVKDRQTPPQSHLANRWFWSFIAVVAERLKAADCKSVSLSETRWFESNPCDQVVCGYGSTGRTTAFQAVDESSSLSTRSKFVKCVAQYFSCCLKNVLLRVWFLPHLPKSATGMLIKCWSERACQRTLSQGVSRGSKA